MSKTTSKYVHQLIKLLTKTIYFVKHVISTMVATLVLSGAWEGSGNHMGINLWEENAVGAHHDGGHLEKYETEILCEYTTLFINQNGRHIL
jgi:hypothetical protein